jgi:hypothetical protein
METTSLTKSTRLPSFSGLLEDFQAWLVLLLRKFSPDDGISRVELVTMLNAVTMKVNEDLSIPFEQVSAIQNWYNTVTHQIDEEELIAIVMGAAPKEFISEVTSKQPAKGDTLKDLKVIMYQQWHQMKGLTEEQDTEITLNAFSGICYQC